MTLHLTEDEAGKALADGEEARQVLTNPLFERTVLELERRIIGSWKTAKAVEEREKLHNRWLALQDIVAELRAVFDTGRAAAQVVDKQKGRQ
jgi:hypothetical protein